MCALVPPFFPDFGWPSTEDQIYGGRDINSAAFLDFPAAVAAAPESLGFSNSSEGNGKGNKKLNHNASERDRRKKINTLFSSLRSLLPPSDQSKNLSIPATVSHALKYIPELQKQVKKLTQTKEEVLSRLSGRQRDHLMCGNDGDDDHRDRRPKKAITGSASVVSATRLSETQVMVQISSPKTQKYCSFANVLSGLEEDGFVILDASSSRSQGDTLFHTLHFQVGFDYKLSFQDLSDKLLSFYERCGGPFS